MRSIFNVDFGFWLWFHSSLSLSCCIRVLGHTNDPTGHGRSQDSTVSDDSPGRLLHSCRIIIFIWQLEKKRADCFKQQSKVTWSKWSQITSPKPDFLLREHTREHTTHNFISWDSSVGMLIVLANLSPHRSRRSFQMIRKFALNA